MAPSTVAARRSREIFNVGRNYGPAERETFKEPSSQLRSGKDGGKRRENCTLCRGFSLRPAPALITAAHANRYTLNLSPCKFMRRGSLDRVVSITTTKSRLIHRSACCSRDKTLPVSLSPAPALSPPRISSVDRFSRRATLSPVLKQRRISVKKKKSQGKMPMKREVSEFPTRVYISIIATGDNSLGVFAMTSDAIVTDHPSLFIATSPTFNAIITVSAAFCTV